MGKAPVSTPSGKGEPAMLRNTFYLLGSVVFLLVLDSKVHEMTGVHLFEIVKRIIRFAVILLGEGGTAVS
jgi:hypothetical protein